MIGFKQSVKVFSAKFSLCTPFLPFSLESLPLYSICTCTSSNCLYELVSSHCALVLFEAATRDSEYVNEFHGGCHGEDLAVGGLSAGCG